MKRLVVCVVLAGPLVLAACSANTAGRAGGPADVLQIAKAREPKVTWNGKEVLEADINCDGTEDYALEGRKGKDVLVMVILGPATKSSKTAVQELPVEELCGEPVALTLESLDYDPEGGDLPGFKRSKKCKGLNLGSGECDAVHLFWNHETASLDTWRL